MYQAETRRSSMPCTLSFRPFKTFRWGRVVPPSLLPLNGLRHRHNLQGRSVGS